MRPLHSVAYTKMKMIQFDATTFPKTWGGVKPV